ncbi:MAG: hypothetical protein MPJ50_18575 [Pirellulales bacterium]|nr:hypothetical protein [Pirellulales bacterium]
MDEVPAAVVSYGMRDLYAGVLVASEPSPTNDFAEDGSCASVFLALTVDFNVNSPESVKDN